jgi:pyruvate/2-oxoglutarate/acetoin dehydrogenase E1 component
MTTAQSSDVLAATIEGVIASEMERDDSIVYMAVKPPPLLLDRFGSRRVLRLPIAEAAMTGMAVGAAVRGLRPVVSWSTSIFGFVAFDQVVNQAARLRYMSGGQCNVPIVFHSRYLNGTRTAAQHTQTSYAYYAHATGLKVAVPGSVTDAGELMLASIRDDNPVVYLEAQRLRLARDATAPVAPTRAAEFGQAQIRRHGSDVTVVAIGYMVELALQAADRTAGHGISLEVIDPRTLVPFDLEAVKESVRRTGRLIVVDESAPVCSMASEVIASAVEDPAVVAALRAAPVRVCAANVPVPFAGVLEDHVLPGVEDILDAVGKVCGQSRAPSLSASSGSNQHYAHTSGTD